MKERVAKLSIVAPIAGPLMGVRAGWGSNAVHAGPSCLFTSWIEGVNGYRLGRWNLASGEIDVMPTFGLLRDALFDVGAKRAHVLNESGLHEVDLASFKGLRKLRKGLPKHPYEIRATGHRGVALVAGYRAASCLLVSLDGYEVIAKISAPLAPVVVRSGDGIAFIEPGSTTTYGLDGRRRDRKPSRSFTTAMQMDDGRIVYVRGAASENSEEITEERARSRVLVAGPGRAKERIVAEVAEDVVRVLGVDARGRMLLETWVEHEAEAAGAPAVERVHVSWLDVERGEIIARVDTGRERTSTMDRSPILAAGDFAVAKASGPDDAFDFYALSRAKDPFASLAPVVAAANAPVRAPKRNVSAPTGPEPAQGEGAARVIQSERFDDRELLRIRKSSTTPLHFDRCVFDHGYVHPRTPGMELRNVTFTRCTFVMCSVDRDEPRAAISDVVFEDCNLEGKGCFLFGLDLQRVTFRGKLRGTLILNDFAPETLARSGAADDWALDISQCDFSGLELRNLPSRLVKRNPEIHGVIRRTALESETWRKLDLGGAWVTLESIASGKEEDGILLVNRLGKRWEERARALQRLREHGIAEPG